MPAPALAALLLALVPAAAPAQSCPDVRPTDGYRVTARTDDPAAAAAVTDAWLAEVARSAAYRWKVPSRQRDRYDGWNRVRARLLPPEPRWADDWTPEARHRAELRLVVRRDAGRPRGEVIVASGDRLFDRSLGTIADDPMPGAPPFPAPPGAGADSVVVRLTFGDSTAATTGGVVHFAATQTRGELVANSLRVSPPPGHAGPFPPTTVKYDVLPTGAVDPASLEFVRSAGRRFDDAVRDGLRGARFRPPTSNCRPVAQTVVQTFGR